MPGLKTEVFYPIHESRLPLVLSAYGGTLNSKDRKLLSILQEYEASKKVNFQKFYPVLWSGAAEKAYKNSEKIIGTTLWNRPTETDVLTLIDARNLWWSAIKLPLFATTTAREAILHEAHKSEDCSIDEDLLSGRDEVLYDPEFMLTMLASVTRPEALLDCRKFIEENALAFVFACLALHDGNLRSIAYLVLGQFVRHLVAAQPSDIPEKSQYLCLLNKLKNSIRTPNRRLSSIFTHFLARVSKLLLNGQDPTYATVKGFLLAKPTFELDYVPEFYRMFHSEKSKAVEGRRDRTWILTLLSEGLKEFWDFHIIERRYGFKILLSYFDSVISNHSERLLILKILLAAASIRGAAFELSKNHNIFGWIATTAYDLPKNASGKSDLAKERAQGTEKERVFLLDCFVTAWNSINSTKPPKANEENVPDSNASFDASSHLSDFFYLNMTLCCQRLKLSGLYKAEEETRIGEILGSISDRDNQRTQIKKDGESSDEEPKRKKKRKSHRNSETDL